MQKKVITRLIGYLFLILILIGGCKEPETIKFIGPLNLSEEEASINEQTPEEGVDYFLPYIDLENWKVTLPIGNPTEVYPPEILDYATNDTLLPFMYNDSTDGSLVFYTYPGASTANSTYSRTELREIINPQDLGVNWSFPEGGQMKGTLAMEEISKDDGGNYHRTIIMQIHGRLSNEQKEIIGAPDNNAPPMLKIYWYKGLIRVKTKVLKDLNATYEELLHTDAWGDDEGRNFKENVGFDRFTLEIIASEGKMEVILNNDEKFVYDNIHMEKWSVFENYFKAGNYLVSKEAGAYAKVKYYELVVSH